MRMCVCVSACVCMCVCVLTLVGRAGELASEGLPGTHLGEGGQEELVARGAVGQTHGVLRDVGGEGLQAIRP